MKTLVVFSLFCAVISAKTVDDYMNTCFDARYHKSIPSQESRLFRQCQPWKDNACCTYRTTKAFQTRDTWLNVNIDHCPGQPLSDTCKRHFMKDLCFYECSPNTGPWIVPDNKEIRSERFVNVPLCRSECDSWWNDCKSSFTCKTNWAKQFKWTEGTRSCSSRCRRFDEVYANSKEFCENVWDNSWKVVPNSEPCMVLSFTGPNPNTEVARQKAEQLVNQNRGFGATIRSYFRSAWDYVTSVFGY